MPRTPNIACMGAHHDRPLATNALLQLARRDSPMEFPYDPRRCASSCSVDNAAMCHRNVVLNQVFRTQRRLLLSSRHSYICVRGRHWCASSVCSRHSSHQCVTRPACRIWRRYGEDVGQLSCRCVWGAILTSQHAPFYAHHSCSTRRVLSSTSLYVRQHPCLLVGV